MEKLIHFKLMFAYTNTQNVQKINLCSTVNSILYIHVQYLLPIYLHIIVSFCNVYTIQCNTHNIH